MSFRFQQVIDCLPRQTVIANELAIGDVAYVHNIWHLVSSTHHEDMVQKADFAIESVDGWKAYVLPNDEVEVVQRGLLNPDKIALLLKQLADEKTEYERLMAEQNDEEDTW
jgi:hypothetical protein